MSEKALELLTKLGITADLSAEEVDIDAIAAEFNSSKLELLKHDGAFLDPIKDEVSKASSIVATKKAKKALNEKWGLGLSNKDLDETDYAALLDLTYDKSKQSATAEVTTLQEQIIALTNRAKEIEEAAEQRVQTVESTWANKYLAGRRNEIAAKEIGDMTLIIGTDTAVRFAELGLKDKGWVIDFNEDGTPKVMQGEYEALKPDKTGKLTVKDAYAIVLDEFIKKSNGAPTGEPVKRIPQPNENPVMAARLAEMQAKFGMAN